MADQIIKITVDDAQVQANLLALSRRGANLRSLMKTIAADLHHDVEEEFRLEGRPPWQRLAASTIAQRTRKGSWPGKILQRSGRLLASISERSDENSATVGSNSDYAAIHQFGGDIRIRAQRRSLLLKTLKSGQLKRQKRHLNLAVFARKGTKTNVTRRIFQLAGRTVHIPARPFFVIRAERLAAIRAQTAAYITGEPLT